MNYYHGLKIVMAAVTFCSFSWAASRFFLVKDQGAKTGKKIISILGLPSMLLNIYFLYSTQDISLNQSIISIFLYMLSLLIFWNSIQAAKKNQLSFAFSDEKPTGVVVHGPYKFIRHPFYASYTIAWIAGYVGTGNLVLLAIAIIMFVLYLKSAKNEERVILASDLKRDYSNYKNKTGMFFPKIIK